MFFEREQRFKKNLGIKYPLNCLDKLYFTLKLCILSILNECGLWGINKRDLHDHFVT